MLKILLASGNKKKLGELRNILEDFQLPVQVVSPAELGLSLETHGDSPLGGIWEIGIPSLVGPGESINLTILEKGEVALERAVWITADESGITVHVSARCPRGGC